MIWICFEGERVADKLTSCCALQFYHYQHLIPGFAPDDSRLLIKTLSPKQYTGFKATRSLLENLVWGRLLSYQQLSKNNNFNQLDFMPQSLIRLKGHRDYVLPPDAETSFNIPPVLNREHLTAFIDTGIWSGLRKTPGLSALHLIKSSSQLNPQIWRAYN